MSESSGDKKRDPLSVNWNFQIQTRAQRSSSSLAKDYVAAVCCGTCTDTHGWGSLTLRAGRIRYANTARSRRPRDEAGVGATAIVNLYLNVHLASPSEKRLATKRHKKRKKDYSQRSLYLYVLPVWFC